MLEKLRRRSLPHLHSGERDGVASGGSLQGACRRVTRGGSLLLVCGLAPLGEQQATQRPQVVEDPVAFLEMAFELGELERYHSQRLLAASRLLAPGDCALLLDRSDRLLDRVGEQGRVLLGTLDVVEGRLRHIDGGSAEDSVGCKRPHSEPTRTVSQAFEGPPASGFARQSQPPRNPPPRSPATTRAQ